MPGAWSKLLDTEEEEDEDVVLKLALAVATTKKKRRHRPVLLSDYTSFWPSWESGTLQQDFRTTREGNVCTHNQYPHMVSVCAVYASVTSKSYGPIATWSDF